MGTVPSTFIRGTRTRLLLWFVWRLVSPPRLMLMLSTESTATATAVWPDTRTPDTLPTPPPTSGTPGPEDTWPTLLVWSMLPRGPPMLTLTMVVTMDTAASAPTVWDTEGTGMADTGDTTTDRGTSSVIQRLLN